jgi:hypothetical protein
MVVARMVTRRTLAGAPPQAFVGAIPVTTIAEFLAQNHISYETAPAAEEWSDSELLARARRFVARINCIL